MLIADYVRCARRVVPNGAASGTRKPGIYHTRVSHAVFFFFLFPVSGEEMTLHITKSMLLEVSDPLKRVGSEKLLGTTSSRTFKFAYARKGGSRVSRSFTSL